MKYLIEEEELKEFFWGNALPATIPYLQDFLKDKKPVELAASGLLTDDEEYLYIKCNSNSPEQCLDDILTSKYKGKNIEIYIKEV